MSASPAVMIGSTDADVHDERLHAQRHVAVLVGMVGHEPRVLRNIDGGPIGEEQLRWDVVRLVLDDARDGRRADVPTLTGRPES
jgi:hypothetical protein